MKKRIISLLLALSMMISLVPVSTLADTGGGGVLVLPVMRVMGFVVKCPTLE